MTIGTRRWWRGAAAVVVAAGGYSALGRDPGATAQTPPAAAPKAAPTDPVWLRSSSPLSPGAASAARVATPQPGTVIPVSAALPAGQPALPPLPALPPGPVLPPPMIVPPPAADAKAPPLPALPDVPTPAPQLPAPAIQLPAPTPLPLVAPPAPSSKSALPAQPEMPVKAVSPLRPQDGGNSVKTDAPWKAPTVVVAPPPRLVTPEPPAAPALPRVADRPKPPETAVLPSERDVFPLPTPALPAAPVTGPPMIPVMPPPATPTTPAAPTPGADPMTFKSTAAAAVLGGALALSPAAPAKTDAPGGGNASETQTPPKDGKDTRTTEEKLSDIQRDLRRLTEILDGRKDEKNFPLPSDPGVVEELRRLRNEVASLKTQIEQMKNSTSLRPPGGTGGTVPGIPAPMPGGDPTAGKGTVRVVNEYPVEITMVVNGRSYRVAPATSQDISIPHGDFSYQLLSGSTALAPTRSTIREREVVTLRIK